MSTRHTQSFKVQAVEKALSRAAGVTLKEIVDELRIGSSELKGSIKEIKGVRALYGRFNWVLHAYCLMTNHYHLLVETPDANLSLGMRQLNGV